MSHGKKVDATTRKTTRKETRARMSHEKRAGAMTTAAMTMMTGERTVDVITVIVMMADMTTTGVRTADVAMANVRSASVKVKPGKRPDMVRAGVRMVVVKRAGEMKMESTMIEKMTMAAERAEVMVETRRENEATGASRGKTKVKMA